MISTQPHTADCFYHLPPFRGEMVKQAGLGFLFHGETCTSVYLSNTSDASVSRLFTVKQKSGFHTPLFLQLALIQAVAKLLFHVFHVIFTNFSPQFGALGGHQQPGKQQTKNQNEGA